MNQFMNNLPLTEIAERIIEAILAEPYINKDELNKRIVPILKIWLKCTDGFRTAKVPPSKLQQTVENRGCQISYWHNVVKQISTPEQMKQHYFNVDTMLVEKGYLDKVRDL